MTPKAPSSGLGLIFVHASWCGPCQRTKPGIEELAGENNGIEVISIDSEEDLDTPAELGLKTLPLLVLTRDGEELARRGSGTRQEIEEWIKEHTG
jgi:thioredoxin 1